MPICLHVEGFGSEQSLYATRCGAAIDDLAVVIEPVMSPDRHSLTVLLEVDTLLASFLCTNVFTHFAQMQIAGAVVLV